MSLIIKGMEMPKRVMVVNIYADGRVTNHFDEFGKTIGKAVPVPPHGRLIDADAMMKKLRETCLRLCASEDLSKNQTLFAMAYYLKEAPTIIPASMEVET